MNLNIIKIASNTENHKIVKNHTHFSKNKNPICGDEMSISLIIKDDKLIDFGYQCKSCIFDGHNWPIFWPRHMGHTKRMPNHQVSVFNRSICRGISRQTRTTRMKIRERPGIGVQLLRLIGSNPEIVFRKSTPFCWERIVT